jgi:hypothetical protein
VNYGVLIVIITVIAGVLVGLILMAIIYCKMFMTKNDDGVTTQKEGTQMSNYTKETIVTNNSQAPIIAPGGT